MPIINCELELILDWSASSVIIYTNVANQIPTVTITETNLYVRLVTLSTQDNSKLLLQLKNGFRRTITWNKYLVKPELLAGNVNLNHLIDPSFQGINKLFILAFEGDAQRNTKTYENIRKVSIGCGDNYTTEYLLDYPYFKKYYKIIAIDLSKQEVLDADPRAIQ